MRRILGFSVLCSAAFISACQPDTVIKTEAIPTAGVRFLNAVPDTAGAFGLDFRFIDIVENSAHFRIPFRNSPLTTSSVTASSQFQYKAAQAGTSRHFAIFLDDTIQAIASTKLKDSTLNLVAGKNYTAVLWGFSRTGSTPAMKFSVIEDAPADPGAQVALRVINATSAPIDVRAYVQNGTLPAAPTWAAVPALSASAYVNVAPSNIMYNVQPAGGGTNLFADKLALVGAPAASSAGALGKLDIDPLPGTTVAGSAVTLIVFPRSVAGSRAVQGTDFAVPFGSFAWDRRPPRGF